MLFPNLGAWDWENSGGRKSLTSHQEPDGRPRDPIGIAGYALVPPTVTGDDAADLQGQVGQLRDSACRGRQDSPVPHPRQVVGGLSQDPAGQDGSLPRGHGRVGGRNQLWWGVCGGEGTGDSDALPRGRAPSYRPRWYPDAGTGTVSLRTP